MRCHHGQTLTFALYIYLTASPASSSAQIDGGLCHQTVSAIYIYCHGKAAVEMNIFCLLFATHAG